MRSTSGGASGATKRARRTRGFRTSRTGFASINPRSTAKRHTPERIASALAMVAAPVPASSSACLKRVHTSWTQCANGKLTQCRLDVPRPRHSIGVAGVFLQRSRDVPRPPELDDLRERFGAARRLEQHPELLRPFLLMVPPLSVALARERARMMPAVLPPTNHPLPASFVEPEAHAARSISRSRFTEPTSPASLLAAALPRRPALIHARKSSGQTTHLLRTFDPTSSPAPNARSTVLVEKPDCS